MHPLRGTTFWSVGQSSLTAEDDQQEGNHASVTFTISILPRARDTNYTSRCTWDSRSSSAIPVLSPSPQRTKLKPASDDTKEPNFPSRNYGRNLLLHVCPVCQKTFIEPGDVRKHMQTHSKAQGTRTISATCVRRGSRDRAACTFTCGSTLATRTTGVTPVIPHTSRRRP